MLLLSFNISNERYVIETSSVIEIIPVVTLKKIPGADTMVAGMLNYHGLPVPVVDINILCNSNPAKNSLTTRIILVKYLGKRMLGLLAEQVTETLHIDADEFSEAGIKVSNFDFLGKIAERGDKLLQLIDVDRLLSEHLRVMLFSEDEQNDNNKN